MILLNHISPEIVTVPVDYIKNLELMSSFANISLPRVLEQLALPADSLSEGTVLSLLDYFRIQTQISVEIHDESLLMSQRPLLLGTNDYVLASLKGKASLFDAMQQLASSYNFIHGGNYNRVKLKDGELIYIIDDLHFPYAKGSSKGYINFQMTNVLIFVHGIIATLTHGSLQQWTKKVQIKAEKTHSNITDAIFGEASINSNACVHALHYDISLATMPIHSEIYMNLTTQSVYSSIQKLLSPANTFHEDYNIKSHVIAALESGIRQQSQVADSLHCSVATLRRNLSKHNVGFRQLKEMVLNKEAKNLIEQHLSVEEIADKLGFSDMRSFIRAFKQWHNMTPNEYINSINPS